MTRTVGMEQKADAQEAAILKMIDTVDTKFERSLRKIYLSFKIGFRYYSGFVALVFYLSLFIIVSILLGLVAQALPYVSETNAQVAVAISLTSAFIALASFGVNLQRIIEPENPRDALFDYNYKMLKDSEAEKNPALFKALVMLKSRHPDLSLKEVLPLPVTKEKLFEILFLEMK